MSSDTTISDVDGCCRSTATDNFAANGKVSDAEFSPQNISEQVAEDSSGVQIPAKSVQKTLCRCGRFILMICLCLIAVMMPLVVLAHVCTQAGMKSMWLKGLQCLRFLPRINLSVFPSDGFGACRCVHVPVGPRQCDIAIGQKTKPKLDQPSLFQLVFILTWFCLWMFVDV